MSSDVKGSKAKQDRSEVSGQEFRTNNLPAMHPVQWFQDNPYIYRHVVLTHGSRALLSLYT